MSLIQNWKLLDSYGMEIPGADKGMKENDFNIGLQIADFIPNTMKKYAHGIKNKNPSIESEIANCLYDGQVGAINIFGLRKL